MEGNMFYDLSIHKNINVEKKYIGRGASVPVCPGMGLGPHTRSEDHSALA